MFPQQIGHYKWMLAISATVAFYALLSFVITNHFMFAMWIYVVVLAVLLLVATVCLFINKRFLTSSILIWVLVACRLLGGIAMQWKITTLSKLSLATRIPFFLMCWVLFYTSREYFEKDLTHQDPRTYVPTTPRGNGMSQLHSIVHSSKGIKHLEYVCLSVWTLTWLAQVAALTLVKFYNRNDLSSAADLFEWVQTLCGLAYVFVKLVHVPVLSHRGLLVSKLHSNGFIWLLLLFGATVKLLIEISFRIFGNDNWLAYSVYVTVGVEIITRIIPYLFHFVNIWQQSRHQSAIIDPTVRLRLLVYLTITVVYLLVVAVVIDYKYYPFSALVTAAHCAGLLATIAFCFVMFAFVAPIGQFITQLFLSLGLANKSGKLHFHSNMAWCACIFSTFHIVIHIINWVKMHDPTYYSYNVKVGTGIAMAICFFGALLTGVLATRRGELARSLSYFHLPLSCTGFVAFFVHSRDWEDLDKIRVQLFEIVFFSSIIICIIFFICELEVAQTSVYGDRYIFLELNYTESNYVTPGSFFNIYATSQSHLSIFHSHSFTVFSTRDDKITFLIQCRDIDDRSLSFTSRLAIDKPSTIKVQGPFKGAASSFIFALNNIENRNKHKVIFLFGFGNGFASVFSLLEYFKERAGKHKILRINCMVSAIEDKQVREQLDLYFYSLGDNWNVAYPLFVVEAQNFDLGNDARTWNRQFEQRAKTDWSRNDTLLVAEEGSSDVKHMACMCGVYSEPAHFNGEIFVAS